jgi:DNA primase
MDCISVHNAGFQNVIASSGTAFTEFQVRLLKRFASKIVVNFDPDTAGAAAAERSLGALVRENFSIRIVTLDKGLDPDLFVRQRGSAAYKLALKDSKPYFFFLAERAKQMYPGNSVEMRTQALTYLLPHVKNVPNKIERVEIAGDVAKWLNLSATLFRDFRLAVEDSRVKLEKSTEKEVSDSELILIRALATARDLGNDPVTSREGQDLDFEPARQAHYALTNEALHAGLRTENLLSGLLKSFDEGADPMSLDLPDAERSYLAEALMKEDEEITAELLESAIEALRRRKLEAKQRELKEQIAEAERKNDAQRLRELIAEKLELDRQLRSAAGTLV